MVLIMRTLRDGSFGTRIDNASKYSHTIGMTATRLENVGKWSLACVPDQVGRIALVTGANSGIGYITARELARNGARVVLACRDVDRGRSACDALQRELPRARIELGNLDLSNLRSIRAFARAWRHDRLDLLVNNAGVAMVPYARTADGFESHFGINHLGTFALTGLLLPQLLASSAARVVTVSSEGQRFARFDFDNLNAERSYNAPIAYLQSKRANLYFASELHRRTVAAGVELRSIVVAPGLTRTNILTGGANKTRGWLYKAFVRSLIGLLFRPTPEGAKTSLFAATAAVPGGGYVVPSGPFQLWGEPVLRPQECALRHTEAAERLWQRSEQLAGVRYELSGPPGAPPRSPRGRSAASTSRD